MNKYKIFVSTCKDVGALNKAREKCMALDLPQKWSEYSEIEAENIEDAFQEFYRSDKFIAFINNNSGSIYRHYLENGVPVLYENNQ